MSVHKCRLQFTRTSIYLNLHKYAKNGKNNSNRMNIIPGKRARKDSAIVVVVARTHQNRIRPKLSVQTTMKIYE